MQIIFVDRRLARARTIDVSPRFIVAAASGFILAIVVAVVGLYALTFRIGAELRVPMIRDLIGFAMRDEVARNEQFVRDNVSALARRVGEMQAQLMRLDALGERVAKIAGIRPEEFNFRELPGRGGAAPSEGRAMSLEELNTEMERITKGVSNRQDYMDVIQSELMAAQVRRALLPQNTPVTEGFVGSGYGMRTDPFTGQLTMHAGVDFAAPLGTPIFAAAGGVVIGAEQHPFYGNAVTIDHGNDISTLYAHASKLLVKVGDIVRRGQKIAEVGTTGRSTGPHLHFEVHVKGQAQNPAKFLAQQKSNSPLADLAPARPSKPARKAEVTSVGKPAASAQRPAIAEPQAAPATAQPEAPAAPKEDTPTSS
ncbi:MAG TPA: peptidoglycan DD-metalloendopeptidase family protein [Burkholderiaceae bacterium]|nr:peptidoglycan DD-metalloendopeptidase family protein [Burkholderiaceae bacterium]